MLTDARFSMVRGAAVLTLILAPWTAWGAVQVSESFNAASGAALHGMSGGTGWGGGWVVSTSGTATATIEAQTLTPPAGYGSPIGGQAVLNANNSASVRAERQLAASIDTNPLATRTIYLSVLFRRDDATNGGGTENSEYLRLDDASNARVATVGQTSGEAFRLQLGSAIVETGIGSVDIGTDYLLIAKLTLNPAGTDDTLEAQLFAASDVISEPVTWQGSISSDLSSVATKFVVSQARFAEVVAVDEIRIGDTFADVAAVPEPASLAALAALGLLTASRRPQRG